jgi:hypothetical protein
MKCIKPMKHLFLLCICLLLSISVYGQTNDEKHFKAGKPVFVIAKLNMCTVEDDMLEREKAELEKNFKSLNAEVREVRFLSEGEELVFENNAHSTVSLREKSDFEENCVNIIYWDGKKSSSPIVYDGVCLATEFFSPKLLKKNLVSSYYTHFMSKLKEYKNKEEKITPRSKDISKAYVYNELMEWLYKGWLKDYHLIEMEFKGVKSIVVKENGKPEREIVLNERGEVQKVWFLPKRDEEEADMQYFYEDGLLRKFVDNMNVVFPEQDIFGYNDNEIFQKAIGKEIPPYDKENSFYYDCDYTLLKGDLLEKHYVRLYHSDYNVSEFLGWVKNGKSISKKDFPITYQYNGVEGKVKMKKEYLWEDVLGDTTVIYYWDNHYHITKIEVSNKQGKTVYTYEYR